MNLLKVLIYLSEKTSEHPIALSLCKFIKQTNPEQVKKAETNFKTVNFKNITGEGIQSQIEDTSENKTYNVLCGNLKLLTNQNVIENYPDIARNIHYLEEEGKTVISLVVD